MKMKPAFLFSGGGAFCTIAGIACYCIFKNKYIRLTEINDERVTPCFWYSALYFWRQSESVKVQVIASGDISDKLFQMVEYIMTGYLLLRFAGRFLIIAGLFGKPN